MPNIDVSVPVSSAPTDRLALGVSLARLGVAGIDATLNPSSISEGYSTCFEGS